MPATEIPSILRRRLSYEARRTLHAAFNQGDPKELNIKHLLLPERLTNFRSSINIKLSNVDMNIHMIIVVTRNRLCCRYHMEETGSDIYFLSHKSTISKWIIKSNGQSEQLQDHLNSLRIDSSEYITIMAVIEIMELINLPEIFQAIKNSKQLDTVDSINNNEFTNGKDKMDLYFGRTSDNPKNIYFFGFIKENGQPFMVTRKSIENMEKNNLDLVPQGDVKLVVSQYLRLPENHIIDKPLGIKSDMELLNQLALQRFHDDWDIQSKQFIYNIFHMIDQDDDGFISGKDVELQLKLTGRNAMKASETSIEMVRLMSDSSDPAEEFNFNQFCAFWLFIFADGQTCDYNHFNNVEAFTLNLSPSLMIPLFEKLFLGTI